MKKFTLLAFLILLGSAFVALPAYGQSPVTYNPDDLLLGFRASGGAGATQDYVVNLGPASQFTAGGGAFAVAGLGNIAADLTAIFGANWKTRADVFWSVSGTPGNFTAVGGDAARTLYATRERVEPDTQSPLWPRRSSTAQGATASKMSGLSKAYTTDPDTFGTRTSTANSPVGIIQDVTENNSYASYQPGGTVANSGGISFAAFSPSIEGSFANGTAGTVLDLVRMVPTPPSGDGDFVGTFTISDTAVVTFTPGTAGASSNADLVSLVPSVGTLTPGFGSATTNYGASVSNATASITITPTVAESHATVTVNGISVASGAASQAINLNPGANTITTVVTAQDGNTTKTYTLVVTRTATANTNADLASLVLSAGTLTPAFASGTTSYAAGVPNGTTTIAVTPTVVDDTATVTVNGVVVASGAASGTINLLVGPNVITTVVTAQDGTTTRTYTLTVTRSGGPEIAVEQPEGTDLVDGAASRSFGSVAVGANRSLTFIIKNTGTANLTGLGITFDGPDAAMFSVTSSPVAPVSGPSGSTAFTVRFAPAGSGAKTAALHIASNDSDESPFDITLTGTGVNDAAKPVLTLSSPAAGRSVAGSAVVFRGRVRDDTKVDRVEVALNGGAPQVVRNAGAPGDFPWELTTLPENGVNTIVVTAYDEFNLPSLLITRTFTFAHVRPEIAGSYVGLLVATADSPSPIDHEGLVKISVARTGTFTGSVKLGGLTIPITGLVLNDGSVRFGRAQTSTFDLVRKARPANLSIGKLQLMVDTTPGADRISGSLSLPNGTTTVAELAHADRALYTARRNPVLPYRNVPASLANPLGNKGKYTALFYHGDAPNNGLAAARFPQGDGYATTNIAASGNVTIVGKLADGSLVSYAGPLSKANKLPVYVPLHLAKRGFVSGIVAFDPAQADTDASAPGMKWFKPANPRDALYTLGWSGGITVDFAASKFIVPGRSATDNILGLPAAPTASNVTLVLADGDITPTAGISKEATVDAKNKVTIAGPADDLNLKATLTAKSGKLNGSFKHPVSGKPVTFGGMVYQKLHTAGGYFLYFPPKGRGEPAPSGVSGSVGIAP
jgi:hypothetical protein